MGDALDLDTQPLNQGLDVGEEASHRHKDSNNRALIFKSALNKPS